MDRKERFSIERAHTLHRYTWPLAFSYWFYMILIHVTTGLTTSSATNPTCSKQVFIHSCVEQDRRWAACRNLGLVNWPSSSCVYNVFHLTDKLRSGSLAVIRKDRKNGCLSASLQLFTVQKPSPLGVAGEHRSSRKYTSPRNKTTFPLLRTRIEVYTVIYFFFNTSMTCSSWTFGPGWTWYELCGYSQLSTAALNKTLRVKANRGGRDHFKDKLPLEGREPEIARWISETYWNSS